MVTAPICKKSLSLAGLPFPGHTEYLAHLTETDEFAMMLMSKSLRVILATRHLALKQVPGALTAQALTTAITLSAQALKWLKVKNPTVGVCALNPHAGDQGLLGNEEIRIIRPTVHRLQRQGLPVEGPIPGDVIFYHALRGRYGAVVALYHDQGLGPLKMLDFDTGINLTLGLPILRVSPDHGTAFDIAGQNTANPASLIVAIQTALRLAQCPNPWMRNER